MAVLLLDVIRNSTSFNLDKYGTVVFTIIVMVLGKLPE